MTALHWLNSEAFTAFDQHVMWSDMIGNLLGLGALALGWRRAMLTWPVQLLSGVVLVAGTGLGTVAVASLFLAYPSLSWNPWPDAYIFVGTLTAMVAQARGWVEFWFAWLAVDLVGVPLNFHSGLPFSGLVYIIYFVLVIAGMYAWWQQTRTAPATAGTQSQPSTTVAEGVTA